MKLSPRDAAPYIAKPDPDALGTLLYGADTMQVALKRQELIANFLGPNADEEMRLTRISAAELRKDTAQVIDALKAQGFFPGPRAVLVEEAADGLTDTLKSAVNSWAPGDAQLIVTAGTLNARSALRKLFEGHKSAYSIAFYDAPPSRDEIERLTQAAGLKEIDREAQGALVDMARALGPGDFRQLIEKLALYKHADPTPLGPDDIAACAPASTEADVDDILHIVAEAKAQDIGPTLRRLQAQGSTPTALMIAALRHFRALHTACSDPGGPAQGIGKLRPPVFGPRRDRMLRQAQSWGLAKLEDALTLLIDTDLSLRSAGQTAPGDAVVERTFIRLAMLGRTRA